MILSFLFSYWLSHRLTQDGSRAQQMALHTLKMMANGGIRDHVGQVRGSGIAGRGQRGWDGAELGLQPHIPPAQGFHRYSTDRQWHIPHFEKMLYDQAQLAVAYSQAFQVTPEPLACPPPSGCPSEGSPGDLRLPLNFILNSHIPRLPPHPPGTMLNVPSVPRWRWPGTLFTVSFLPTQISGDEFYSNVARGILQYVARNLGHRVRVPRGGRAWLQEASVGGPHALKAGASEISSPHSLEASTAQRMQTRLQSGA